MMGLKLNAAKALFFDRPAVKRGVDHMAKKVLSKFGAFVRQRAKTSIRKRKGASAPGSPPHSHVGLLRKFILFGYDAEQKSVVIGPTLLNTGKGEAPRLLEYGGETTRTAKGKTRTLRYQPRPFMRPARDAELPKFLGLFRDTL